MKKTIATLVAVVMIAAVIDVAVAAATSMPHAKGQQQTSITITYYPKQVTVGQYYNVTGELTSGGTGLSNKVVFPGWQYNGEWAPVGGWVITNADGTFTHNWHANTAGTASYRHEFSGDAQYSPCFSDVFVVATS